MSLPDETEAWLECEGKHHVLDGNCSIGRAALNELVLESSKVSRLHAIVHLEVGGAFWIIDLGSSNGSFLNGKRLQEPARLHDHDQIMIGGTRFIFRQPGRHSGERRVGEPLVTLKQEIENVLCWLLVADICEFTPLSRTLPSQELASLVGAWLAACKEIIDCHGGALNKYLGDGILAFWRDNEEAPGQVIVGISALKELQAKAQAPFRFVVHYGSVTIGGVAATREETLMGSEVNLAFRLEKLAGSLGEPCAVSDAVRTRLHGLVGTRPLGRHQLKGFEGEREFFAL